MGCEIKTEKASLGLAPASSPVTFGRTRGLQTVKSGMVKELQPRGLTSQRENRVGTQLGRVHGQETAD